MLSTPKAKAELFLASSLYDGLEDNNIVQVTTLLLNKEADPNVLIPSQGITPFHLVIGNDSETFAEEVTKLFLRHGGNPNVKSVDGMTPVHVAAAWGRLGVLELLLSNGGDPLLVDDDGRCPFHYAFDEAHYDAVATLGKYCGESFEEDSDPKYNIVLDKILMSNGGIVAEYAVSEDSAAESAARNVPAINTSKSSNNNDHLLKNMNQHFGHSAKAEIHASERQAMYPAYIDLTITTTADESSISLPKFVNVRRHRRCLPRKNSKYPQCKLDNEDKFDQAGRIPPQDNIPALDNRPSISHLNDPIIEASFLVQPRKVGENMPRVSSPKSNEKLTKSERGVEIEYRNIKSHQITPRDTKKTTGASKFVHKTPLRSSKRAPLVEPKKTPTSVSAKKVSNFKGKITPNNGRFPSSDRAPIRTPSKYISKQISYSPDCSIVSKSPNLIRTPLTPTNNHRLQEESKNICIGRAGTPSKNLKRIPTYGSSCKTPTPDKLLNNGNCGKNFSRFVKQSDLRYQGTKKTPISSPCRFRVSPTWSKKCTRTPNLTYSTKRKKKSSTGKTNTALTPSCCTTRLPSTPLDKTYSKNEYSNAADLSPDVETTSRFVDRRNFARNIAIKLEETMYDDDCDKRITSTDVENMKSGTQATMNSGSSIALERDILNAADNRWSHFDGKTPTKYLASNEWVQISGLKTITDSTKVSEGELTNVRSLHSYNDARGSNIIAGFFQPGDVDSSSVRKSDGYGTMNNVIPPCTSRPHSIILASNSPVIRHPTIGLTHCQVNKMERCKDAIALAACLQRPNSKEIDESLVSSECSCYSLDNPVRDPKDSMNSGDTGLSNEQGEYFKNGATPGVNVSKSEVSLPPLTEENHLADRGRTRSAFPNVSSSVDSSSYASFVSVGEEYKYEDPEEGVILLERRLLITPVSIPMIKSEGGVRSPSEESSQSLDDESMVSCVSSLPHSLVIMDSETLRTELTKLDCRPPGPITATTRHVYLRRLRKLQKHGPAPTSSITPITPKFSPEIERTLRSDSWMNDLSPHETLEQQVFKEFSNPDPTRRWREGTTKSSFNYLLMDPRITDNLPRRSDSLSPVERWRTFLSSIFYVGKGRRSRPYAHLYEAYGKWKEGTRDTGSKKVNCILDIWTSNCGVVCLHFFQNTIPVEAYTREAAMIEALGLDRLKNCKSGEYYGVAATWSHQQKRALGIYLLYKAMHILLNEGERQLSPDDIGR